MMLTTALRPFHIDSLDDLLDDLFEGPQQSAVPIGTARARPLQKSVETIRETKKGIYITTSMPGKSKNDVKVEVTRPVSLTAYPSLAASIAVFDISDEHKAPLMFKLPRKANWGDARCVLSDGVLRIAIPRIAIDKRSVAVHQGTFEDKEVSNGTVSLRFQVPGFAANEIHLEIDADNERIVMFGQLSDKSRQFHRNLSVPRTTRPEHVEAYCSNGLLDLRIQDPHAIEPRTVEILSAKSMEEKGKEPISLMRHEVPGFSSKDLEFQVNADRTIEAKRGIRTVKIGLPNTIAIETIRAYCEHGIFEVLGDKVADIASQKTMIEVLGPTSDEEKATLIKSLESVVEEEDKGNEDKEEDAVLVEKK